MPRKPTSTLPAKAPAKRAERTEPSYYQRGVEGVRRGIRLFHSREEAREAVDAYFDHADAAGDPYTIYGLCRTLGCTRQTLLAYSRDQEYSDVIEYARARVRERVERMMLAGEGSPAGLIFWAKNNMDNGGQGGWSDRHSVEVGGDVRLVVDREDEAL